MKIIRQYEFGTADVLNIEETSMPSIGEGEVLIQGAYTSINFADIKNRTGAKLKGDFPFTLGLDIAGTVIESRSSSFQVGDRVIAFPKNGSYAQVVVAHGNLTYAIPDQLSFEQAAAMPTVSFLASVLIHHIAQVTKDDIVIIHSAAGGVGSMLVTLCKQLGCQTIIGTVSSPTKFNYVKQLGAHIVCTYEEFVKQTLSIVKAGATVIFDSVAGEITSESLKCLAPFGTLVQFGNSSGLPGNFSNADVHNSCRSVKGFSLGTTRKLRPEMIRLYAERIIDLFTSGALHLQVDQIFELKDVKKAHETFEKRQHTGKILLKLT